MKKTVGRKSHDTLTLNVCFSVKEVERIEGQLHNIGTVSCLIFFSFLLVSEVGIVALSRCHCREVENVLLDYTKVLCD